MGSNSKGSRRERELTNLLDERQWAVMRAPSSGAGTQRELPDVLAGNGTRFVAIEAKASSGDPIYVDGEEVDALRFFAENFGADPLLGVRFDYCDWAFFAPDDVYQTDGGNYRIKKDVLDDGLTLPELTNTDINDEF